MGGGRVSLPDIRHLTALAELGFGETTLVGALPHLPALRVLVARGIRMPHPHAHVSPGPRDLNLTAAAPLLTELCLCLGCMIAPHEQLATLAPLAHLRTLLLCFRDYKDAPQENLLRSTSLLSLPPSITKLVLYNFQKCEPAVALPENIAVVLN